MNDGLQVFKISPEERERSRALREHFASFWNSPSGEPRAIYDRFISATPLIAEVELQQVKEPEVQGWWARPPGAIPKRAILFIHGGGYIQGSAQAYRGFASQIASRAQASAFVIDYPLAPESSLPSATQAALQAYKWMASQGFERIAVVGDSAGGGLTLVTLQQLVAQANRPAPVAGVTFSPWTDLSFTGRSFTDPTIRDPLISYTYLQQCAANYLGGAAATEPLASPVLGKMAGLPPLLLQVGTDEILLDDSRAFYERARQAGVAVQLEIWEEMHHVFQLDVDHLESSRAALDRAGRFLSDAFSGGQE